MLKIIQSQRIESLFNEMLAFFDEHPIGVFEPRQILIPSHGVGVWLKLHLASTQGIVAQVSTDFMGAFQWDLYGRLAERDAEQKLINGAPQAPLSASIMRWQIFAYIWQIYSQAFTTQDSSKAANAKKDEAAIHALGFLLKKIVSQQHHTHKQSHQADNDAEVKRTIWVLSSQIAQVFAGYVTYRADWLRLW
ncbi:MAG: exodeoxyribonuclease V subunit gamma, partial [Gammaproteobacteria bacterium]|nr:exodeoxyribonuclease V subunit gamma [Gammaproteobacteria bacterium]